MKFHYSRRATLALIVAALAASAAATYAFRTLRKNNTPPNPTLPQAYEQALQVLGTETNAFYCVSATSQFITESAGPTEWHLVFYSTNGQMREVIMPTSEKAIVRDKLREEY
jgi:hypothetical protein